MKVSRSATLRAANTQPTEPHPTRARRREPSSPLVLGRYRLHRRLGSGGFGTVWLARDERLDRDVAIKVLPRERIASGRFEREARAAARLSHPAIVTLYEAAVDDDGAYLVSELVRGATLDQLLEAGRLSDRDIVQIGLALCDALMHAHGQAVVHRDVKPSNVLVPESPASPEQWAKLTDFGVARVVGGDTLTRTGDVLGTAGYMSPEQAAGRETAAPADLYSLALVLYEALTGANPLRASTPAQRARRLAMHLPPVRRYRRDLPRDLACGIDQALRPRPRERGSLEDLRRALVQALEEVADRPGVVEPAWRPGRRTHPADHGLWSEPQPPPAPGASSSTAPARWRACSDSVPESLAEPWPGRAAAAIGAGALAAGVTGALTSSPALSPVAAGALAGGLVALLPRLGWILSALIGCAAMVLAGDSGAAMVLALALLLPVLLLPLRSRKWPLAVIAPVLGLIGLAGAWPSLAARAPRPWQRAALGAVGWVWLLVAGALAGHGLYGSLPWSIPAPAIWTVSAHEAARHVLTPLAAAAVLAPGLVWAAAAAVLPGFTAGGSVRARVMLAGAWSLALVLATVTTLSLTRSPVHLGFGAAALGAIVAGLLGAVPYGLRRLA